MNRQMAHICSRRVLLPAIVLSGILLIFWTPWHSYGRQVCESGNEPLHKVNYPHWKHIMPVINHKSRVYYTWTNGNENFHYRGDTNALNNFLKKFAAIDEDVQEVFLSSRQGLDTDGGTDVPHDWQMHLSTGLVRGLGTVRDQRPTVTIFLAGDNIEAKKIKFPKSVTVIKMLKIAGQCVDTKGKPVKGAEVSIYEVNYHQYASIGRQGNRTTDGQGRFEFSEVRGFAKEDLRNWDLIVLANSKEGSAATLIRNAAQADAVRLILKEKPKAAALAKLSGRENMLTIAGVCIDTKGKPVKGAEVSVNEADYRQYTSKGRQIEGNRTTDRQTTEGQGRFEFSEVRGFVKEDPHNWDLIVLANSKELSSAALVRNATGPDAVRLVMKQ